MVSDGQRTEITRNNLFLLNSQFILSYGYHEPWNYVFPSLLRFYEGQSQIHSPPLTTVRNPVAYMLWASFSSNARIFSLPQSLIYLFLSCCIHLWNLVSKTWVFGENTRKTTKQAIRWKHLALIIWDNGKWILQLIKNLVSQLHNQNATKRRKLVSGA